MTHVSNLFNEVSNKVEKLYQVEVVDFDGIATIVEVLATSAAEAQAEAALHGQGGRGEDPRLPGSRRAR